MDLKRHKDFLIKESKVATDESPLGYYDIANAVMPDDYFKLLEEQGIEYKHDAYRNFIEVFVENEEQASFARKNALDYKIFDASDVDEDHIKYEWETPEDIGDAMEIKMKQS